MKKGFSATEFLKRSIEFEEKKTERQPKLKQSPQAEAKPSADTKRAPTKDGVPAKTDDLRIDRSFYKVPNVVDDLIAPTLSAAEEVIYRRLIRMSWGWGRNYCRAGIKLFQQTSGIKSRTTIKTAIDKLVSRKIIYRYVDTHGRTDRNQNGTVYIVPVPNISKSSIPNIGIPENGTSAKTSNRKASDNSIPNFGRLKHGIPKHGIPDNGADSGSYIGIPENGTPSANADKLRDKQGIPENGIPENDTIKDIYKHSFKDTLSPYDIVSSFYKGIGQKRVTKTKRERAEKCIKELLDEEFSLEDIHYATQWTLDNSKEDIYDFSIIKHTIGQAMVDKEKSETEKARKLEREKMALQEKEEERRNEEKLAEVRTHKEELSETERTELRKKAMDEIAKMEGVRKEFVTPILIEAKENEILRAKLENDG